MRHGKKEEGREGGKSVRAGRRISEINRARRKT
jgi:hypothetical protein